MQHHPVELTNVIYNATTQAFEARVTVHDPNGRRSYACAVMAPIVTEYERASELLSAQALRRHRGTDTSSMLPQASIKGTRSAVAEIRRLMLEFLRSDRAAA